MPCRGEVAAIATVRVAAGTPVDNSTVGADASWILQNSREGHFAQAFEAGAGLTFEAGAQADGRGGIG